MNNLYFSIAKNYSREPGLRYDKQSDFSGENFRDKYLVALYDKAAEQKVKLVINLDHTFGYGPSFLEESFGGLARLRGVNIMDTIELISNEEPNLIEEIKEYVNNVRMDAAA